MTSGSRTSFFLAILLFFLLLTNVFTIVRASGDSYEPDDSMSSATYISLGQSQSHTIDPPGDVDYLVFELSSSCTVTIETSGSSGGDTVIDLYDSSGSLIEEDDDSGSGYWSRIVASLSPGTYYVSVRAYFRSQTFSYTISLSGTCGGGGTAPPSGDSYEPDDSMSSATYISLGQSQSHTIDPPGDVDYLVFELSSSCTVTIETSGSSGGDTVIDLYDSSGSLIEEDDDSGSGYWSRIVASLSPGTYYVSVRAYFRSQTFSYTISLSGTCGGGGTTPGGTTPQQQTGQLSIEITGVFPSSFPPVGSTLIISGRVLDSEGRGVPAITLNVHDGVAGICGFATTSLDGSFTYRTRVISSNPAFITFFAGPPEGNSAAESLLIIPEELQLSSSYPGATSVSVWTYDITYIPDMVLTESDWEAISYYLNPVGTIDYHLYERGEYLYSQIVENSAILEPIRDLVRWSGGHPTKVILLVTSGVACLAPPTSVPGCAVFKAVVLDIAADTCLDSIRPEIGDRAYHALKGAKAIILIGAESPAGTPISDLEAINDFLNILQGSLEINQAIVNDVNDYTKEIILIDEAGDVIKILTIVSSALRG